MSASMAEGIAEVLMAHWTRSTHTDKKPSVDKCDGCGEVILTWGAGVDANEALAAHQAEVLAANGYGNVGEAQARAYDKGYGHGRHDGEHHPPMSLSGTPRPEKNRRNPYRAVTERGGA